ncbi:U1-lycotoxin-Ls1k like protein [Argiope bruennichi]|uniref:U1-lycotoxin-Ls1k like protein n=1 Tax=Argiope bruennichi TaxID=94029 RepID=A0A8T0EG43_ARGBR|nr:U1-lycotoxin-Ls1k like protein [Argiope bruennichi]
MFPLSESLDELDAAESRMSLSKEEYRSDPDTASPMTHQELRLPQVNVKIKMSDEETFPLSESLDEFDAAESRMSLSKEEYRKEDRKCIEKHHECTHDKHNCCRGKFFKYECHCHDVVDEKGKKRERCACHNPLRYKVVDLAWNVGTKMV